MTKYSGKLFTLFAIFNVLCFWPSSLKAELDPELAQVSTNNNNGIYIDFGLNLGMASVTNGNSLGTGLMFKIEPGFIGTQDSWGRVELSLAVGYGIINYQASLSKSEKTIINDQNNKDVTLSNTHFLIKIGYGYSLGYNMFLLGKFGGGPVFTGYKAKSGEISIKDNDTNSFGIGFNIGIDLIMTLSDTFNVIGGGELFYFSKTIENETINNSSVSLNDNLGVSYWNLMLGIRVQI